MAQNDIAIKVENLSKYYKLGLINNGTLFKDIQSWIARKRGKEDPHARIDSKFDSTAEGFWALKDLNFEIKKGDRVGIIGHNGAGKSTLLKILSQITAPTEGSLKINGKISSLLEVGTGFHSELTGRENIFMNGAILGMTHAEIDSKVNQIIEFSEIGEYIDTPVKRYSSGMYVRLAFAVAAHLDSDILIADEVLAVGDAAFQKKALGKMNDLSTGEGRTVLFVSHNMAQVKALCNKGMVLEKGQIVKTGELSECAAFYEDSYKKNYRMNILKEKDTRVKRGNGGIDFTDIYFSKDSYFDDEDIEIKIKLKTNKSFDGLYFCLDIKQGSNGIIIAEITKCIEEGNVASGYEKEISLKISSNQLSEGSYPLYFWLGDYLSYSTECTYNYCVLDEYTPNLVIKKRAQINHSKLICHLNAQIN